MKHFDITQWADAARGLASNEDQRKMRSHLDAGCARCQQVLGSLMKITALAQTEVQHSPPEYARRSVQAYFEVQNGSVQRARKRISLPPIFDSRLAPAPFGVRSGGDDVRRISYESDKYTVDLTVEQHWGAKEGIVVGQLLELSTPRAPVPEIPAFLVNSGSVTATGMTSNDGAFVLEGDVDGSCELWFFPDEESVVGVTWDGSLDDTVLH